MEVVHPDRLEDWFNWALDSVTGALAEILLVLLGITAFAFQMSTVIDPLPLAEIVAL